MSTNRSDISRAVLISDIVRLKKASSQVHKPSEGEKWQPSRYMALIKAGWKGSCSEQSRDIVKTLVTSPSNQHWCLCAKKALILNKLSVGVESCAREADNIQRGFYVKRKILRRDFIVRRNKIVDRKGKVVETSSQGMRRRATGAGNVVLEASVHW